MVSRTFPDLDLSRLTVRRIHLYFTIWLISRMVYLIAGPSEFDICCSLRPHAASYPGASCARRTRRQRARGTVFHHTALNDETPQVLERAGLVR